MSYMGTHNRIRRVRGSARNYVCACGQQAREWAYNNESPNELVDELGRRYSRDLNDYTPMCFRCHRIHDKAAITHCPQGHAYEGRNILMDAGKRKCRTCAYERVNKRRMERQLSPEQRARKNEMQRRWRASRKERAA